MGDPHAVNRASHARPIKRVGIDRHVRSEEKGQEWERNALISRYWLAHLA